MTGCLVFNHHSLPYDNAELASTALPTFVSTFLRGQRLGLKLLLLHEQLDPSLFRVEVAPSFFIQDWYEQKKEDKECKEVARALKSLQTRQPLLTANDIEDGAWLMDVRLTHDGATYDAIKAAVWNSTALLGFPSRAPWDVSPLSVTIETLDNTGKICVENQDVPNLCSMEVVDSIEKLILERRRESLSSGRELLSGWSGSYPNLLHCGKVSEQLASWSHSTTSLNQAKESLAVLDLFGMLWSSCKLKEYNHQILREIGLNHDVSGESATVRNNPDLRKHREFWLPSGSKEFFENHIKLGNGMRIHFFTESISRKVYVGYIGPHLPLK